MVSVKCICFAQKDPLCKKLNISVFECTANQKNCENINFFGIITYIYSHWPHGWESHNNIRLQAKKISNIDIQGQKKIQYGIALQQKKLLYLKGKGLTEVKSNYLNLYSDIFKKHENNNLGLLHKIWNNEMLILTILTQAQNIMTIINNCSIENSPTVVYNTSKVSPYNSVSIPYKFHYLDSIIQTNIGRYSSVIIYSSISTSLVIISDIFYFSNIASNFYTPSNKSLANTPWLKDFYQKEIFNYFRRR